jgi:hypothetical protein
MEAHRRPPHFAVGTVMLGTPGGDQRRYHRMNGTRRASERYVLRWKQVEASA